MHSAFRRCMKPQLLLENSNRRRTIYSILGLWCCLFISLARADDSSIRSFDLPSDAAAISLRRFSEQAGSEVLFSDEIAAGVKTNPFHGESTPVEALRKMLDGTPLVATQDGKSGAFIISRRSPPEQEPKVDPIPANAAGTTENGNDGSISGQITSHATGRGIPGATVTVSNSPQIILTDEYGRYRVADLPPGTYSLHISYEGMVGALITQIEVKANRNSVLSPLVLFPVVPGISQGSESIVTAQALNTVSAGTNDVLHMAPYTVATAPGYTIGSGIDEQHQSPNIVNEIPAEAIDSWPVETIAGAIERLPGVGIQKNTSEARYAKIRGTDPDFNDVTYDGITLDSSMTPGRRAIPLDYIPQNIVASVEVYKSVTPDMDGESIGGLINLVPKSAFDYTGEFSEAVIGGGFATISEEPTFRAEESYANVYNIGGEKRLGIFVTGEYYETKSFYGGTSDAYVGNPSFADRSTFEALNEYLLDRRRYGGAADFDLKVGDTAHYFLDFNFAAQPEMQIYDALEYLGLNSNTPSASNPSVLVTNGKSSAELLLHYAERAPGNLEIIGGGDNRIGVATLDYKLSYVGAWERDPYYYGYTFATPSTLTFAENLAAGPRYPSIAQTGGPGAENPSSYTLQSLTNTPANGQDEETALQANLTIPCDLGPLPGYFKFGVAARIRGHDFDQDQTSTTYTGPSPAPTVAQMALQQPLQSKTIFGGTYSSGPVTSYGAISAYMAENPNDFTTAISGPTNIGAKYEADENIFPVYGLYSMQDGPFDVLAGVRAELTDARYSAYSILDNSANAFVSATPVTDSPSYWNVMPDASLKYNLSQTLLFRLNVSSTIARPTFAEAVPAETIRPQALEVITGNPNLKPIKSTGFDLTTEFYPANGVVISAGVFDKEFRDYIYPTANTVPADGTFASSSPYTVMGYSSVSRARLNGVELSIRDQFVGLPGLLGGLGIEANTAMLHSEGEFHPGINSSIPNTASNSSNLGVFYEHGRLSFNVNVNYTGSYVSTFSTTGPFADTYTAPYVQLDVGAQYRLDSRWTLFFEGVNLNDGISATYEGQTDYYTARDIASSYFNAGVKLRF